MEAVLSRECDLRCTWSIGIADGLYVGLVAASHLSREPSPASFMDFVLDLLTYDAEWTCAHVPYGDSLPSFHPTT